MSSFFPQGVRIVEAPLPALAAIECHTLRAFLGCVRLEPVLMAHLVHQFTPHEAQGLWEMRFAVHLTGRGTDLGRPVCYATFLAAIVRGTNNAGRMEYPFQGLPMTGTLSDEVHRLVSELHQCLDQVLRQQPSLMGIRPDERYPLPDAYVWGVQSDASTHGIAFRDGHWTISR